jgi:hypothetical protein
MKGSNERPGSFLVIRYSTGIVFTRVVDPDWFNPDPDWFNPDPDPAFFLNPDPDPS